MRIGIVAGGPVQLLPDLMAYDSQIDYWIGVDRGAYELFKQGLQIHMAIGDFDSVTSAEREELEAYVGLFRLYPEEKNETDLELALEHAFMCKPREIYLFGVTGGRLDHTLINIQLLHRIQEHHIIGSIIDNTNCIQLKKPGMYAIDEDLRYSYISFIPFSERVASLSLSGFKYPLHNEDIRWGDTLCISNELIGSFGTFSYRDGILLVIKSRDILNRPTTSSLD